MSADGDWDDALARDVPRLAALLRETGAEEIEIGDDARTIRVRRIPRAETVQVEARLDPAPAETPDGPTRVTSEQVGVFISSGVQAGDSVEEAQAIGVVDVLGVAHDVYAPADGVVERFLVRDGEVVEYGQPLAELRGAAAAD